MREGARFFWNLDLWVFVQTSILFRKLFVTIIARNICAPPMHALFLMTLITHSHFKSHFIAKYELFVSTIGTAPMLENGIVDFTFTLRADNNFLFHVLSTTPIVIRDLPESF